MTGKRVRAADVAGLIRSNTTVFVHGAAATPQPLLDALAGRCGYAEPECATQFRSNSLFTGPALRKPIEEGRADFTPVFLSDIPLLFTSGRVPLDAAILQLS